MTLRTVSGWLKDLLLHEVPERRPQLGLRDLEAAADRLLGDGAAGAQVEEPRLVVREQGELVLRHGQEHLGPERTEARSEEASMKAPRPSSWPAPM